ncbi:DNA polymerase III subunit gamma/tau [Candidatus Kinetoplastibacterium desouzaii TCC079E]|uniref:DNA polymerase III subunit gamma/tau n=1 Tax=Candidatus Kinetoplastidibacterium desouzai TCC079E TaxID=1208919 RepID=M1L1R2_9PROT|nr:DNA polymerase III subunit gamma/tau [Candidatus Kinetoplastibacterium desouzaii]AGF46693.1 DNA polymerase III subunit gamma/tau [Candidatus Kinetoplastibacterium desouzaii TCC079E]
MSYLALARKWRPRFFEDVMGQDHVVKALVNALNSKRLHHAWLFSGPRGVGKTSIARILAKSLNCINGITSNPCGKCDSCIGIDVGGTLDYLELDAASNRGVDEMSILLEQANYTPVSGRFKVFLIDEVHMLTNHAFNSMLKTLEEPPEHVKFIFATTDLHKIPITVLSRCLCFNLRNISTSSIISQLVKILESEKVIFETSALDIISRLANGSIRDALSLSDQAISYGNNSITEVSLRLMLGMVDVIKVENLLRSIMNDDANSIIKIADDIINSGFSYEEFLSDLAVLLSEVAISQQITGYENNASHNSRNISFFKHEISQDLLNLLYAVVVNSSQELDRAPDHYIGFIMICLRLVSLFKQGNIRSDNIVNPSDKQLIDNNKSHYDFVDLNDINESNNYLCIDQSSDIDCNSSVSNDFVFGFQELSVDRWVTLVNRLTVYGFALELAKQSEFIKVFENTIVIKVAISTLASQDNIERLQNALCDYFGVNVKLNVLVGADVNKTAYEISKSSLAYEKDKLIELVKNDVFVQDLVDDLDGEIISSTISKLE